MGGARGGGVCRRLNGSFASRYNGAQRERNHYEGMAPETRGLLDALFCDHNRDLAGLLADAGPDRGPLLLPSHGYACVD